MRTWRMFRRKSTAAPSLRFLLAGALNLGPGSGVALVLNMSRLSDLPEGLVWYVLSLEEDMLVALTCRASSSRGREEVDTSAMGPAYCGLGKFVGEGAALVMR